MPNKKKTFQNSYRVLVLVLVLVVCASCTFPRDIVQTMERVEGDRMLVGVVENPPWVIRRSDGTPAGIEVDLVQDFADEMDAKVLWKWGEVEGHMAALEHFELDLVIGGITGSSPWRRYVAFTQPYYTTRYVIAVPPDLPAPEDVHDQMPVAVEEGTVLAAQLEDEGAVAVRMADVFTADGPILAADWQIAQHDYIPTDLVLHRSDHVMAVPPGENRWLLLWDRFLLDRRQQIQQQLR